MSPAIVFLALAIFAFFCGDARPGAETTRIVGGQRAEEGQFPYYVSLRYKNFHFCGGSILTSSIVLTAAHCVIPDKMNVTHLTVVANAVELEKGGDVYRVKAMRRHPDYDDDYFANDIGYMELADEVRFSRKVKPVEISEQHVYGGVDVVVMGFGATKQDGANSPILKYITVKTIPYERCLLDYGVFLMKYIKQSTLCTDNEHKESFCSGDSGGPLVTAKDEKQVGLVSFSPPCGSGSPDAYTRISSYAKYVKELAKKR